MNKNFKIFLNKFSSFTIIELLVALSIISVASLSTVSVFSYASQWLVEDKDLKDVVLVSEKFLTELYCSENIKDKLFNSNEIQYIEQSKKFPVKLSPQKIEINNKIYLLVNKVIHRWDPLTVDIGIETIIDYKTKKRNIRKFWIETTISENYLNLMK